MHRSKDRTVLVLGFHAKQWMFNSNSTFLTFQSFFAHFLPPKRIQINDFSFPRPNRFDTFLAKVFRRTHKSLFYSPSFVAVSGVIPLLTSGIDPTRL